MRSSEYWKQRFEILEQAINKKDIEYYKEMEIQYRKAVASVQKDVDTWYNRFADNNEISLVDAKKLLNGRELEELRWTVEDYIKYGELNAVDGKWAKQLESASSRVHLSRLEALQLQLQQHVETLYGGRTDGFDALMRRIYTDNYYQTAYEVQKGLNLGWSFNRIDTNKLDNVLSRPWTSDGRTFSDRIWTQKLELLSTVHTELTQAIIRGDGPDKAIAAISKRFDVSRGQAGRLVMTESAYFASQSQLETYKNLGVEKYRILATLDLKTSDICQAMDGRVFDISEWAVGVTAPPFHVWCRTTTIPDVEGVGERAAKGAEGKTYYVSGDMKYEEWHNANEHLNSEGKNDILISEERTFLTLDDVDSFFSEAEAAWIAKLTDDEKRAVFEYSDATIKIEDMQDALRAELPLSGELLELSNNLSSGLVKWDLSQPIVVFRGTDGDEFKGIGLDDLAGRTFPNTGFKSTSVLEDRAFKADYTYAIKVPKDARGAFIRSLSACSEEQEFLIDKSMSVKVTGIDLTGPKTIINAEVVFDDP